jgi:hypothetical protein
LRANYDPQGSGRETVLSSHDSSIVRTVRSLVAAILALAGT